MKRARKKLNGCPADEARQRRFFNAFMLPIHSREWHREPTSAKPRWTYLASLHSLMLELEKNL